MATATREAGISLPQDPVPERELESHLVRTLQAGGLKGDALKQMSKAVAAMNAAGVRPMRVFPKGIVIPDGVRVQTIVGLEGAGRLVDLLRELPQIDEIRIFPKGIPFPDILEAEIGFR
ncbi:hypothetical protein [Miltoncostaea marina]|uniref:hypothetical protein n=1 Tax=Miltoncostaea marina TaxID=2843215 RepID=UPI001C3DF54A|nr:hypothetical protein [Miltoncostaea marina]